MANAISFYDWLEDQSNRDDVIGDLAIDVKRCRNIPKESEDKDMCPANTTTSKSPSTLD